MEDADVFDDAAVGTRRWSRIEYHRLADAEILGPDERIELVGGLMIVKEPQHRPHVTAVQLAARALRSVFGPGWDVQVQAPIALADDSEPEPDVSVVAGDPRDYGDDHPRTAVLVVEASLSRLGFDRGRKGGLYARAGIAEYWIVNLPDRRLEVYREPVPDAVAPFGWRYGRAETLGPGGRATILALPGRSVAVGDLLP
jgi:Uma2 family endonuclease